MQRNARTNDKSSGGEFLSSTLRRRSKGAQPRGRNLVFGLPPQLPAQRTEGTTMEIW